MPLDKSSLEELYSSMSISEMSRHLGISRSTLYYQMKKLGITRRSRSEAQKHHISTQGHQRLGKKHDSSTKSKISESAKDFWDSDDGELTRKKLRQLRQDEWNTLPPKKRKEVLDRLKNAEKPTPGSLSRFGERLRDFLSDFEEVKTGIQLTSDHVSDIILEQRSVVIELVLPFDSYGEEQRQRFVNRYNRLVSELNDSGYRVVVIQDKSNTLSRARCQRVYDSLLSFFKDESSQTIMLIS